MGTQFFSDGASRRYANQYETPYEAFINFMNILNYKKGFLINIFIL